MNSHFRLILAALAVFGVLALAFVIISGAQAQAGQPETGAGANILEQTADMPQLQVPESLPIGIWLTETVDSVGNVGQYTSLELDDDGQSTDYRKIHSPTDADLERLADIGVGSNGQIPYRRLTRTTITSDNPDPSQAGQPIRVYVRVESLAGGSPSGTVNITTIPARGSCSISGYPFQNNCSLTISTPGSYMIRAYYQGNQYFYPSSDTEPHSVEGIFLDPPSQSGNGLPGAVVDYAIQLHNGTQLTDRYNLALGAHNWVTLLSDSQIGPLAPGASETFTVTVTIPPDANWYDTDSVVITASSVANPTQYSATAQVTTQAYAPPQISVAPLAMSSTQFPNTTATQSLTISNGLGVTLTYNILSQTGPVLYLPFNESAGATTFTDASGHGNDGSCTGMHCPVTGAPGMQATAVDFDGVDDYISIPHSSNFDLIEDQDRVTIAAWIKIRDWMENVFPIIDIDEAANDFGWAFEVHPGGVFLFTREWTAAACAFVPDLQEWYHLAVTYDRGAGTVTFHINGNVACQSNYSEDIEDTVGDPIYVGWSKAGPDEYSNGVIDELVVFDRALTLPEIQALYYGSGGSTGWLSIHPNSGTVPTNSSVPLQAIFDSTNLQPAEYSTDILIISNDPLHSLVQVPVTMTVLPTPSMGWVEGTVSDRRTGDSMVAAISAAGQPYTVTSSLPGGHYRLWLEPGAYELRVSAPGYVPQTQMVDIQTQQGTIQDFALLLDAPWLQFEPDSLTATQMAGEIITRELAITNGGTIDLDYLIAVGNKGVSFNSASTELYGYAVPGAWLRVTGLADDTQVEVIDLATGQPIISSTLILDRYEVGDFYPFEGAHYKVRATKPVVAYASDFNGYGHLTFIPSIQSGPVGKEFIFYFHCGDTIGDYCYVFAIEDAQVEVYDPSGALIASQQLQAGEFWQLGMPNGVYRIVSTGNIDIEISAEDSYSSVPSVDGDSTGYQFYFATHFQESGAFAVFAYQDAQINVYDLETGSLLYTHTLNRGEYWWQTDVYLKKLKLESTGLVEVWAGATEGGTGIENLGDDVSFTTGEGGLEFYTHSLMEGSIIFAPFDDTTVNVDGTIYELNQDEYLDLGGCCYFRHITSSKPILVTTLGAGLGWGSSGTYLGGIVSREGGFPSWLSTSPLSGTLQSNHSQAIAVTFDASGVMPGVYSTTLEIISNDPLTPLVQVPVTMTVQGEGIWLEPVSQTGSGRAGSQVVYNLQLYNHTPITDTYTLESNGNAWLTSLSTEVIGPLPPGSSQSFTATVSIPADLQVSMSDTVVITAISLTRPEQYTDSALITTHFWNERIYLPQILSGSNLE